MVYAVTAEGERLFQHGIICVYVCMCEGGVGGETNYSGHHYKSGTLCDDLVTFEL